MRKKTNLAIILVFILGLLGLPGRFPAGGEAFALESVKIGLAFRGSYRYDLPINAAQEKGYWKEQGLELEAIPFSSAGALFRAIAARSLNLAMSDVGSALVSAVAGIPIIIVADLGAPQPFGIWVLAASPIKEARDLKGTKIGISRMGGGGHAFGVLVVRNLGLEADVRFVALGGQAERMAALKRGSLEAFVQTLTPMANLLVAGEVREVISAREYLPKDWIDFVLSARRDFTETRPQVVRGVARALLMGGDFVAANPRWAREKMKAFYRYSEEAITILLEREAKFGSKGVMSRKAMESTANFFVAYGIIAKEKLPPLEQLFTNRFVE